MKKGLFTSYISGIKDKDNGESFGKILGYFLPEFITSLLLYSMPFWIDAYFIGHLQSTPVYGTLGATNNLLHFVIKIAEALSVGTVILSGRSNGLKDYKQVGRTLRDSFWVTTGIGAVVASMLFFGARMIYTFYVPTDMIELGVPFLRLRAIGVFLMFMFLAFVGFLRGIKNTKTPMKIFISGALVFLFFDYALIFGKFGLPQLGLQGSAVASIIQYGFMFLITIVYIVSNKKYHKYNINLFQSFSNKDEIKHLLRVSWPILLDKSVMAFAYIWLCAMIKPMGSQGVATFCVLKDMERFALVPAIAFAQVITILVSNDFGTKNWTGIKSNIKKILFMASVMVFSILLTFSLHSNTIIQCFDRKCEFTPIAAKIFPLLSILVFFDLLQLILSGALRGAANVRTVMFVRLAVCFFYFAPVSFMLSRLPIQDMSLKILLIYGSFYIGNALMSIVYIRRFRGEAWKTVQSS